MAEERARVGVGVAPQRGELGRQVVEAAGDLPAVRTIRSHRACGGQRGVEALRALALPHGQHSPPSRPGIIIGRCRERATGLDGVIERLQGRGQAGTRVPIAQGRGHGEQRDLTPAGRITAGRLGARCSCEGIVHDANASAALGRPRQAEPSARVPLAGASTRGGASIACMGGRNRLADEASLYLRQHAENPVDWWPWGPAAFADARDRDVPVLLSVGYSSCHWCHVMAHESFEDPATARAMNAMFTCVKVDREELPDVDALYMQATMAMAGHGGWPMTVFLTPAGEPFWAGTYFPPEPRHGMPSFMQVLDGVAEAWRERREQVMRQASTLVDGIRQESVVEVPGAPPSEDAVAQAVARLGDLYDDAHGGFGGAPKFPPSVVLDLLLRRHWAGRDPHGDALAMAVGTLDAMASGGVCDQVGGGFHRYAVDDIWLVPHFEKMLYDNALLLRDYAAAARLTGAAHHALVAERIAAYLLGEMRVDGGGFAAAQDADSPGGEGAYFTWTPAEIREVLSGADAEAVIARFGVSERGNFEGRSILRVVAPDIEVAPGALASLYAARAQRPAPSRDDKVIASWNGLAIGALAEAGMGLRRDDWIDAARDAAHFVLGALMVDGRLMRVHAGGRARHLGSLEDHADMVDGLLALYAADFDPTWLQAARGLADAMLALFADPSGAGFFMSGADAPALIARTRDLEDHPSPSGNSQAAWVLARLHLLTGEASYRDAAAGAVALVSAQAQRWPQAFGRALATADLLASRPVEVAVAGPLDDPRTVALVDAARMLTGPYAVIAAGDPADPRAAAAAPLLAGRPLVDGAPAAYACSGFTCQAPAVDPEALLSALRSA